MDHALFELLSRPSGSCLQLCPSKNSVTVDPELPSRAPMIEFACSAVDWTVRCQGSRGPAREVQHMHGPLSSAATKFPAYGTVHEFHWKSPLCEQASTCGLSNVSRHDLIGTKHTFGNSASNLKNQRRRCSPPFGICHRLPAVFSQALGQQLLAYFTASSSFDKIFPRVRNLLRH